MNKDIRVQRFRRRFLLWLFNLAIVGLATAPASAQTINLDRQYEPVIIKGSSFTTFSGDAVPVIELFLYKYSAGNWAPIPFQIDEVEPDPLDATKTTFFQPGNGRLDDLDELSFMARDAGEKADANNWVTDAAARGSRRYEIELSDPLPNGNKGYVYLYRSTTLSFSPDDYATYVPPQGQPGNDVIQARGYEEGHQANGIHTSLLVPISAGGSGNDFVDRLKLRFQISILGSTIPITENDFNLLPPIRVRDGKVRVIRELRERISFGPSNIDFPILIIYYGYSTVLGTGINLTNVPVPVNLLRQSFDFEANVNGARWFNQNLANAVTVDGTADNLTAENLAVVNAPNLNWSMLSSAHGSFVNIFALPAGFGTTQQFYYHDAPTGSADGTPDTGANGSYGDSGFLVRASSITGNFALSLVSFMLGKDQLRSTGESLRDHTTNPVVTIALPQDFSTGVQETSDLSPRRFVLQPSYPNPVSLAQPSVLIRYELPWSDSKPVELRIYNLIGQKVRELVNTAQTAGNYETRWDGRLENGELAPAGIYFYQLRAGGQIATRKLVLLSK